MGRRIMDWSGNIIEYESTDEPNEKATGEGLPPNCLLDSYEQHLANRNLDDESQELADGVDAACNYEADNLFECPDFYPEYDDDTPDVVECKVCGRIDWRRKQSRGRGGLI